MKLSELIQTRPEHLPGYAYKLAEGGHYGLDVSLGMLETDEGEMSVRFPFADGRRRDGVGDLLEVGGIDLSRHRKNPIVLFDHGKKVELPIGLAEDPSGAYTVEIDPTTQQAWVKAYIYQGGNALGEKGYDHALFCQQLFDLMVKRYVRSGSIGYQVKAARKLPPDHERGTPEGLHLLSILMLEASAVVLPANADTAAKALCLGDCCGKPLSPMLVKALSPYAVPRKAQLGYEGKSMPINPIPGSEADRQREDSGEEIKRLKAKYTKAALTRNLVPNRYDPLTDPIRPGDTATARSRMTFPDGSTFCRPGDKVTVMELVSGGLEARVRNREGKESRQWVSEFRKGLDMGTKANPANLSVNDVVRRLSGMRVLEPKDQGDRITLVVDEENAERAFDILDNLYSVSTSLHSRSPQGNKVQITVYKKSLSGSKSLDVEAIRKKYRPTKALRRRLRKSSPGSSVAWVAQKDLEKCREMAAAKGVKLAWLADGGGVSKVKLMGDDGAIDEVAKAFGRPVRRVKSLSGNGAEVMAKELYREIKSAPEGLDENLDVELEDEGKDMGEEAPVEPFSAQMLRHRHQQHAEDMANLDAMMPHLEHEPIKKWFQGHLEKMAKDMDELEALHAEHHPDAEPLMGAGEHKDMGDGGDSEKEGEENAQADDVSDEELDQVLDEADEEEGQGEDQPKEEHEEKALTSREVKSLKAKYKTCGCKACKSGKPCPCSKSVRRKDLTEKEEDKIEGELEDVEDDLAKETADTESKGLSEHHMGQVKAAHTHLKTLSEADQLTDDMKMECYHHGKNLESIAAGPAHEYAVKAQPSAGISPEKARQILKDGTVHGHPLTEKQRGMFGAAAGKKGAKSEFPGDMEFYAEEASEPEHQGHPHMAAIKAAGGYLKKMATEQAFGRPHQEEALNHYKALEPVVGGGGPPPSEEEMEGEPGHMDQKALKDVYRKQDAVLDDLIKQVDGLARAVGA